MLREETVEPATLGLLKKIVTLPEMKPFRLAGGTALSLLFGHRKSIDLDFFTDKPLQKDVFIPALEAVFGKIIAINERSKVIYQCTIQDIKIDFVSVTDSFSNPIQIIDKIPFADTKDLIALKLNAIKGRGVKKDFWDVAKLLEFYSFEDLFKFYYERYPYDDTQALTRSIVYFADAEDQLSPESLDGMTWTKVKEVIIKSFDNYNKKKYRN
jgi:hypothetical protein